MAQLNSTYLCVKTFLFVGNHIRKGKPAFTKGTVYTGHVDIRGAVGDIELTDDTNQLHTITPALFATLFEVKV